MYGWIYGWMDGWMDVWMGRWMGDDRLAIASDRGDRLIFTFHTSI